MKRQRVLAAVLVLLSLPSLVALIDAVSFHAKNRSNRSILSSGVERDFLVYVPESYDETRPTPLVISMHGAGGWPVQQRDLSGWNEVADRHGFVVVYPSGVEALGFSSVWRVGEGEGLTKDVQFISDLLDELETSYNIDRSRIYANGLSNGGGMAFVLSCTLSDRFAAVGMVGAARTLPFSWCREDRPIPMIAFHGTADPIVPYEGGTSWIGPVQFPEVEGWIEKWALRNECGAGSVETLVAEDVVRREYGECADDASVVLFTIAGGGHAWPGPEELQQLPEWFAGPTTRSVDATKEMWTFFREHALVVEDNESENR